MIFYRGAYERIVAEADARNMEDEEMEQLRNELYEMMSQAKYAPFFP